MTEFTTRKGNRITVVGDPDLLALLDLGSHPNYW